MNADCDGEFRTMAQTDLSELQSASDRKRLSVRLYRLQRVKV